MDAMVTVAPGSEALSGSVVTIPVISTGASCAAAGAARMTAALTRRRRRRRKPARDRENGRLRNMRAARSVPLRLLAIPLRHAIRRVARAVGRARPGTDGLLR